jgi:hypothetical protein
MRAPRFNFSWKRNIKAQPSAGVAPVWPCDEVIQCPIFFAAVHESVDGT